MLKQFVPQLVKDLELGDMSLASETPGSYVLPLKDNLSIQMTELPSQGFILKCAFAPSPKEKEELFYTQAMLANLFGQGTHEGILGLNGEGTQLTLTRVVDYQADYKEFKEILEDFINTIDLWREEAANPTPIK